MPAKSEATTSTEYLGTASNEFVTCRLYGHLLPIQIDPVYDTQGTGADTVHIQEFECPRCGTIRQVRFDWDFRTLPSRYIYPDGYRSSGLDLSKCNIRRFQFTGHAEPTQTTTSSNSKRRTTSRRKK